MTWPEPFPDLQADERTTLTQHLDHWRERILAKLDDLDDDDARSRPLPATSMSVAGIVKHLAYVEDRWFSYRLAGGDLPEPWASETGTPEELSFRVGDATNEELAALYRAACDRSRAVTESLASLDALAPTPSFGKAPCRCAGCSSTCSARPRATPATSTSSATSSSGGEPRRRVTPWTCSGSRRRNRPSSSWPRSRRTAR